MSKGKGQKIAIKFDKPLLGDVSGNKSAFTVTGMQRNPLGTGELQPKQFTVDKVERYPISTLYEDDFSGMMDGVEIGINGIILAKGEGGGGSYTDDLTGGLTYISTSDFSSSYAKHMAFDNDTVSSWSATGTIGQAVGVDFGEGRKISKLRIVTNGRLQNFDLEGSNDNSTWAVVYSGTQLSNSNWQEYAFENSASYRYYRVKCTGALYTGSNVMITEIEMMEQLSAYLSEGSYTTSIDTATLPANPRLKWDADLPAGANVTTEYAISQETPTEWVQIENGNVIEITEGFLWLKFTLSTTDTTVTPTLLSVWLEEAESPPDTILLTFDTYNRFNDVEGDITVAYSQGLGTLAGTRPVESFSLDFTPADLLPTDIHEHTITVGMDLVVDLITLQRTYIYADHDVSHAVTAGFDLTVALIDVKDINP